MKTAIFSLSEHQVKITVIQRIGHLLKGLLLLIPVINVIVERWLQTSASQSQSAASPLARINSTPPSSSDHCIASNSFSTALKPAMQTRTYADIEFAGEIPVCSFSPISEKALRIWPREMRAKNPRVDVNIGWRASCFLHFGPPAVCYGFEVPLNCAVVRVEPNEAIGVVSLYFSDEGYTKRLAKALNALGCQVQYRGVDLPPGVIGPEYYHALIQFIRPEDFLFFAKKLCVQTTNEIVRFVEEKRAECKQLWGTSPIILESINQKNLFAIKDTLHQIEEVRGNHLAPPPKIWADDVAKNIGAMTSLLVPGYNSLVYAREGKNLVHVTLSEARGLSLYFPDHREGDQLYCVGHMHALRTFQGFQTLQLQSHYSNLAPNHGAPFQHGGNQYSGLIHLKEPMEIVRFLMQICKQTRDEVAAFVQEQEVGRTKLGEQILLHSKKRKAGEEDYDLRIVMSEDRHFDFSQVRLNLHKMRVAKIPDLPLEARNINVEMGLREVLNTHVDAIIENGLHDRHSKEELRQGIENILTVFRGGHYPGLPNDPLEAQVFRQRLAFFLRHVLFLLRFANEELRRIQIAHLAIGGLACAGRHVQAAFDVINVLRVHCLLPHYHDPEALGPHLSLVEQDVVKEIDRILTGVRKSLFDQLAERYRSENGGDLAHLKNVMMKSIGLERGILGAELGDYSDPYLFCAVSIPKERILQDFDALYTPAEVVRQLRLSLRYQSPTVDMGQLMDFFQLHAPKNYQEEGKQHEFLNQVLNDDYLTVKEQYIIQMLKITNHFT